MIQPPPAQQPCAICANLLTRPQGRYSPWALLCSTSSGIEWTIKRIALEAAARARCKFCRILFLSVLEAEQERSALKYDDAGERDRYSVKRSSTADDLGSEVCFQFRFRKKFEGASKIVQPVLLVSRLDTVFSKTLEFDIGTASDDPLAEPQIISHPHVLSLGDTQLRVSLPVRRPHSNRGAGTVFSMVNRWVKSCDDKHRSKHHAHKGRCFPRSPAMPTRLIDVSRAPAEIRLVDSAALPYAPYAALSYCWGESQSIVTTTQTLALHMVDIPVSLLPWTLLDAVKTTRWLGLKYLWVDALCVVQDSEDDKELEMSRMQRVFQNAYVTIVAARARAAGDGFLKADNFWHPVATLPVLCENGDMGNMLLLPRKERRTSIYQDGDREPLHTRGWSLQEVVLSPRLLVYGQDCIVWKCLCDERGRTYNSVTGQEGSSDWNGYCASAGLTTIRLSPSGEIIQPRLSTCIPNLSVFTQSTHAEKRPKLYRLWNLIVQDYSNRKLTNPEDKLPALSGIVSYFHKGLDDVYVAGLWHKYLLHQLSWTMVRPGSARRPPAWRAPSWSWMAIDGAINFETDRHTWFVPLVQDAICKVVPLNRAAPFSRLRSGFLQLRGSVRRYSPAMAGCSIELDARQEEGEAQGGPYWLLLFAKCCNFLSSDPEETEVIETAWGLVLSRTAQGADCFQRIGHFTGDSRVMYQFSNVMTVKIL